ncbi:MAG: hypothetical protein GQ570_06870 [Helicobacteraceae bacterium]|nr:hypothetical protein [Helicobacteraceae bacterium]
MKSTHYSKADILFIKEVLSAESKPFNESFKKVKKIVTKKTVKKQVEAPKKKPQLSSAQRELLMLLSNIKIFNNIDINHIATLTKMQKIETLTDGADIFMKFKMDSYLAFLLHGEIEIMDTSKGFEYKGSISESRLLNLKEVCAIEDDGLDYIASKNTKILYFQINTLAQKRNPTIFIQLYKNIALYLLK